MSSRLRIGIIVLLCSVALLGFGCKRNPAGNVERIDRRLVMWGLWETSSQMQPIIDAFETQYGIGIDYKKIAGVADYERQLLEALAQGRGPDVFVVHHTWIEGKRGLMSPAPRDIIDERALREEFVEVVSDDLLRDGFVYALPTSVDTLALYYNKDLLNSAGIANPPETWQELQRDVEKITKVNRVGDIRQSGIALGTAQNINRAGDILQILMLQSGLPIVDDDRNVVINTGVGANALSFYTDFANTAKKVYSWNLIQDYSLDAFAEGDTAMMINYSYHVPTIEAKNPRLNFGIARLPQIPDSTTNIDFAAYWPFAVSNTSSAPEAAWLWLRFMTSAEPAASLNTSQKLPPARRDAVLLFERDPILGVFAEQILTAKSWPRVDIVESDAIFAEAIDGIIRGSVTIDEALRRAEDQLRQLQL